MFKKILFTGLVAIGLSGGSAIGQSFSELSSPNKPLSDSIEGKSELAYDFQQSFDNIESMKTYLLLRQDEWRQWEDEKKIGEAYGETYVIREDIESKAVSMHRGECSKKNMLCGEVILSASGKALDYSGFADSLCEGRRGLQDFTANRKVVVYDGDNNILAVGKIDIILNTNKLGIYGLECTAFFTIEDIPKAKFYQIKIGDRKPQVETYKDLEKKGWLLEYQLIL